ncbi:LLM class flavin-dependent oxidoreductase [Austwickia sp. TVS 96-490-7B]|uniref:LLM class flavin-dependent oxidoreductase n=1 Tax=Austwickia sp. TVS 96-490-7B TaxID=2830843 RepID=UPI00351D8FD6
MTVTHVPLSILDLSPTSTGRSRRDALEDTTLLAQAADRLGYTRYWVAEHHGSDTFMASATALILGHLASRTDRIRLGSGGVMLPNHAPLMVAEYYGTLATLYGDRFDLGLGRAPGTDPMTAAALRRHTGELDGFAQDVTELHHYLAAPDPARPSRVRAVPGEGTAVPLWMLGSSLGGAAVAAHLGLPFVFASHFAPDALTAALQHYREHFNPAAPTAQITAPYVVAGVNALVAPTSEEAAFLATTGQRLVAQIATGRPGPLEPPQADLLDTLSPQERAVVGGHRSVRAIGSPQEAVAALEEFVAAHQIDEIITTTYTHDPRLRLRSYDLLAEAWGLTA